MVLCGTSGEHAQHVCVCLECLAQPLPLPSMMQSTPHPPPQVRAISRDHGAEIYLDKQARKWANELIAEEQQISDKSKAVKGLISVSVAYTKVCVNM